MAAPRLTPARCILPLATLFSAAAFLCRDMPAHGASLEAGFRSPPPEARPWVYWFWLDGNITREGITADLEAMKRAGIGGVLIMEVDQGAPKGPARFAGPEWRALFQHVAAEAARLGLEVNMNNDAGWCGSGGPWITPELAMQKLVWTETSVEGRRHFTGVLPRPEAVADYYRDIAVLAFPTPAGHARIEGIKGKAAYSPMRVSLAALAAWPALPPNECIDRRQVVDLTNKLARDGRLDWDIPPGKWTVLRLGHTPTGKDNHPAPEEGRGLECDKLSKAGAEAMFHGLMQKLIEDVGPLAGKTLVSTHIDSWEVGCQNWTPKFREEFRRLRGYDPIGFLPVMTGRVVDSLEVSERFLWDLRQTISELLLENYAGHFRELAHRRGLRLSIEAYTTCPTDEMAYAGRADEPMGEFWSWKKYGAAFSCTEMASAAHVYGKRIVGAEAFTATNLEKWQGHPGNVKDLGDWAFCEGINRFVFHRYALQPWPDRRPGMSMGPWGLHYERTQTWWEQSRAWHEYLARCQFLLQQGLFVADICMMGPEGSPQTLSGQRAFTSGVPGEEGQPLERPGYNFDTCPPEVVLARMTVKDGRLVLPDGMSYRLLVLPRAETMTPRLLGKIKDLVEAGATVMGPRPLKSPSLSGYPDCDKEVKRLADELWGDGGTTRGLSPFSQRGHGAVSFPAELTERRVGKGRVVWGGELEPRDGAASAAPRLKSARWIWHDEGRRGVSASPGNRYFRRVVTVEPGKAVESAWLVMTADNAFQCWVNGHKAGEGSRFTQAYLMNIAPLLRPGQNLVAVEANNATDKPNPAGLIGVLKIKYRDGGTLEVPTDGSWQSAAKVEGPWTSEAGAPQGWVAARVLGPLGMEPWGDVEQPMASPDLFPDVALIGRWLAKSGLPPDFSYRPTTAPASSPLTPREKGSSRENAPQTLRYIHRTIEGTEVYFVANKNPDPAEVLCSFRIQGRRPELWWPDSGRIERPAVYDEWEGCTRLPLRLDPSGSVFVVFRQGTAPEADRVVSVSRNGQPVLPLTSPLPPVGEGKTAPTQPDGGLSPCIDLTRTAARNYEALIHQPGSYTLKTADGRTQQFNVGPLPKPLEISGPWEVQFAPGWGAPEKATFDTLISWSDHPNPGIKYFSGAATYRKSFGLPSEQLAKDRRLYLDLGRVEVVAEVKLNAHELGILWKPPFRVEITGAAKAGRNVLEIRVTNLWINRQIGDEQLPEDSDRNPNGTLKAWPQWLLEGKSSPTGRYTFTSWRLWKKDDPLAPSGLLGPVTIHAAAWRQVEAFGR